MIIHHLSFEEEGATLTGSTKNKESFSNIGKQLFRDCLSLLFRMGCMEKE